MGIEPYREMASLDHWFENVLVLPGVVVAVFADPSLWRPAMTADVHLTPLVAGLLGSIDYVLDEPQGARSDASHPVEKNRPAASGRVDTRGAHAEWGVLGTVGITISLRTGGAYSYGALDLDDEALAEIAAAQAPSHAIAR